MMENKNMLSDDAMDLVTGGAKTSDIDLRYYMLMYKKLETAWFDMGFDEHGHTRTELDALCDQWEAANYTPADPRMFLAPRKDW